MSGGGHKSMGRDGFDHLIYVRIFEGCNLHCEHCFIPSNPKRMTHEDISKIPENVRKFAKPSSTILIQWHGGEPTLFGHKWLEESILLLEKNGPEFIWKHGIQTNLMNYNEEWNNLYHKYFESEVGISWDPIIRLMRKNDPNSHAKFNQKFWENVHKLNENGLTPYLVTTATKTFFETFKNPSVFFDLLVQNGIKRAHLERVTETGYARENWEKIGLSNKEYSQNMQRFLRFYQLWKRNRNDGSPDLNLSPFDGLMESVEKLENNQTGGYGCWSGACDNTFHTIDSSGYKRGCTAITSEIDNKWAGKNILNLPDPEKARNFRTISCKGCPFRPICSSGCLALSMDDGSGECSGASKLFETAQILYKNNVNMPKYT